MVTLLRVLLLLLGPQLGLAAVAGQSAGLPRSCPSPAAFKNNTDFKNDDLYPHASPNISTAEACCALCAATVGCNAFSYGGKMGRKIMGCRLKKGQGTPGAYAGRVSFSLRRPPPPPPPPPQISEVHVVFSNHFDGGCKVGGCNNISTEPDFMWPIGCAMTMHGPGQPHAYHVINRYFDEFFPHAASLGDAWRAGGGPEPGDKFVWMTQPWIVSLFLHCEDSHYHAWDGSGRNLLHCPNASAVARFKRAVKLGDIFWHAAATDQEAEFFPNVGLFNASMVLAEELAEELGVARPLAVSTRDGAHGIDHDKN